MIEKSKIINCLILRWSGLLFLCSLYFGPGQGYAYTNDSLFAFIQKNKHAVTSDVLDTLINESKALLYDNPKWSRRHAEAVLMLAPNKRKYSLRIGVANRLKGETYLLENEYELSLSALKEAERWFGEGNQPEELAQVKNLMGACYQGMGETKTAIALGFQALKVLEKHGPDVYLASTLETLGNLFSSQQKYEEAQDYYLKSWGIRQSLSDTIALARTLLSIARIEGELHHFTQARDYNVLALNKMRFKEFSIHAARGAQQLGYVLGQLGELDEAVLWLEKAQNIYQGVGNTTEMALTKTYLGEVYLKQEELPKAEELIREAMGLARDTDQKDLLLPIYKLWAEILSKKGMAQPAVLWYQKAYELRDSLLRLEHMNHLTRVQADLALDAKTKENDKLKEQSEGQIRQIQFQKATIILFLIAIVAISGIFYQVFKNRMMLKKAYEIQEKQKKEITLQAHELKEANEHISRLNSQLEKKVERRSRLISEKNRKLEKYAFELSHGIRSPLSNVLGIIHLMKQNGEQAIDFYLEKLESSARHLDDIVRETSRSIEEGD